MYDQVGLNLTDSFEEAIDKSIRSVFEEKLP